MEIKDSDREKLKELAVEGAMNWIADHYDLNGELKIGIGSGSTVGYLFDRLEPYDNLIAVPTSLKTERELKKRGVRVGRLEDVGDLIFDLDGADEVDPQLNLMKGGGGSHYREKKVAKRSELLLIVVDGSKIVDYLGQTFPLPVEVLPERRKGTFELLRKYGVPRFREEDGGLVKTDNENVIIDVQLSEKLQGDQLVEREREINTLDGVVENGYFADRKADLVFVGTEDGLRIIGDERIDG